MTRYDYMKESNVFDDDLVESDFFPDPLNFNVNYLSLSKLPKKVVLNSEQIKKFWVFIQQELGTTEGEDIILFINNIKNKGLLKPGDVLYIPNEKLSGIL